MVSRLPATKGALVSLGSIALAVALLAQSLTGNPGVTGPVPVWQFVGNGICLLIGAAWLANSGGSSWPRVRLALIALALFGLLSLQASLAPHLSSLASASLAGFVGIYLVLDFSIQDKSMWRLAATCFTCVALVSAMFALYGWAQIAGDAPLTGTFTNQDCYSVIPLLGGMLALGLAVEHPGAGRLLFAGAFCVLTLCLLLTASRAGLLALGVAYAGFLFTLGASRSPEWRKTALQLLLLPTVLMLTLLTVGGNLPIVQKWDRLARGEDPVAVKSRWDVVRHGYRTILRRPWLGSGLGCFSLAYQQDRPPLLEGEDYMNVAHNDYIQWLVETGLPGGLAWVGVLFFSVRGSWRSYRSPTSWVGAQLGLVLGLASYCALNFACPVPADFLWIGAVLGLGASLERLSRSDETAPQWSPKAFPLAILLAAWAIWTVRFGLVCFQVERASGLAAVAASNLDWEEALARLGPATQRQPQNHRVQFQMAELCRRAYAFSGKSQWLDGQRQALEKACQANPRDLQVLLGMISFLQDRQQFSEASACIDRAENFAPYSAHIQRAKARNQILTDQLLEATTTLARTEKTGQIADDPALADLIFLLEWKAPKSGTKFLSEVYFREPARACQLGQSAARRGQELREFEVALRFLKHINTLDPTRLEVLFEIALTRGLAGEESREIAILNKLRQRRSELDPLLGEKVWKRWSELQIARGELDLTATELEDYLITHPRQVWARQALSEIFLKKGQKSEARAALRDGLSYDQDGSLRLHLGDLCAAQGLSELARGYYREALPLTKDKAAVEERIRKLGKTPQLEDEEL